MTTTPKPGPYEASPRLNDRLGRFDVIGPRGAGTAREVLASGIRRETEAVLFAAAPEILDLLAWALEHAEQYVTRELSDSACGMKDDLEKMHRAQALVARLKGSAA